MNLTEQIDFLTERAARSVEVANRVADVPMLARQALEDAAALTTIANTLRTEQQRLADHVADWS